MWAAEWLVGQAARVRMDADVAGIVTDPAVLRLKVRAPGGAVTTYTYGVDDDIVRNAVGSYHADIPLTAAGEWIWRWETDAPTAGAAEGALVVARSRVTG